MGNTDPLPIGFVGFRRDVSSADTLEKLSNFCLFPVRISFGKEFKVLHDSFELHETVSKVVQVVAGIFYILLCPLTISLTIAGTILANLSKSYMTTYKAYSVFVQNLVHADKLRECLKKCHGAAEHYDIRELEHALQDIKTPEALDFIVKRWKTPEGIPLAHLFSVYNKIIASRTRSAELQKFKDNVHTLIEHTIAHSSLAYFDIKDYRDELCGFIIDILPQPQIKAYLKQAIAAGNSEAFLTIYKVLFSQGSLDYFDTDLLKTLVDELNALWLEDAEQRKLDIVRDKVRSAVAFWLDIQDFSKIPETELDGLLNSLSATAKILMQDVPITPAIKGADLLLLTLATSEWDEKMQERFKQALGPDTNWLFLGGSRSFVASQKQALFFVQFILENVKTSSMIKAHEIRSYLDKHATYLAQEMRTDHLAGIIGQFLFDVFKSPQSRESINKLMDALRANKRNIETLKQVDPCWLNYVHGVFNDNELKELIQHYAQPENRYSPDRDSSIISKLFWGIVMGSFRAQKGDKAQINDSALFNKEKERITGFFKHLQEVAPSAPELIEDAFKALQEASDRYGKDVEMFSALQADIRTSLGIAAAK